MKNDINCYPEEPEIILKTAITVYIVSRGAGLSTEVDFLMFPSGSAVYLEMGLCPKPR